MPKGVRWGDLSNGENLYVTKSCKYPVVAWDFVKFLETDTLATGTALGLRLAAATQRTPICRPS